MLSHDFILFSLSSSGLAVSWIAIETLSQATEAPRICQPRQIHVLSFITMALENRLCLENNLLVCIEPTVEEEDWREYRYLKANFCGRILDLTDTIPDTLDLSIAEPRGSIYACGNVQLLYDRAKSLLDHVRVIREFSYNFEVERRLVIVSLGEVSVQAFIVSYLTNILMLG